MLTNVAPTSKDMVDSVKGEDGGQMARFIRVGNTTSIVFNSTTTCTSTNIVEVDGSAVGPALERL